MNSTPYTQMMAAPQVPQLSSYLLTFTAIRMNDQIGIVSDIDLFLALKETEPDAILNVAIFTNEQLTSIVNSTMDNELTTDAAVYTLLGLLIPAAASNKEPVTTRLCMIKVRKHHSQQHRELMGVLKYCNLAADEKYGEMVGLSKNTISTRLKKLKAWLN